MMRMWMRMVSTDEAAEMTVEASERSPCGGGVGAEGVVLRVVEIVVAIPTPPIGHVDSLFAYRPRIDSVVCENSTFSRSARTGRGNGDGVERERRE